MTERVGLVLVSHSALLARGVAELAAEMAPDVRLVPAGGLPDGGLGTDFDTVTAAFEQADQGAGAILFYDLGSAKLIADMIVESLNDPHRGLVIDAPIVEGAVAAAVAAQGGAGLAEVAAAAVRGAATEPAEASAAGATEPTEASAAGATEPTVSVPPGAESVEAHATRPAKPAIESPVARGIAPAAAPAAESPESSGTGSVEVSRTGPAEPAAAGSAEPSVAGSAEAPAGGSAEAAAAASADVLLTNAIGLHARPAALLARAVAGLDAAVTVAFGGKRAEAGSILAVMALGARGGDTVRISATGPQASEAVNRIRALAGRNFDE